MKNLVREIKDLFEAAPLFMPSKSGFERGKKGFEFRAVEVPGKNRWAVYARGGSGKERLPKSTKISGFIFQGIGGRWFWNDGLNRSGSEDRRGSDEWVKASQGLLDRYHRRMKTKGKRFKASSVDDMGDIDFGMM